jgi:hypothetical protein
MPFRVRSTSLVRLTETAIKLPKGTMRVKLTCGHIGLYPPPVMPVGDIAFCRTCDAWTTRTSDRIVGKRKS